MAMMKFKLSMNQDGKWEALQYDEFSQEYAFLEDFTANDKTTMQVILKALYGNDVEIEFEK